MSNSTARIDTPVRWRAINACRRCRQRKVKCSGVAPCRNCASRRQSCIFDETDRRIVISERHLRDLERRARDSHGNSPSENQLYHPAPVRPHERSCNEADTHVAGPGVDDRDRNSVTGQHLDLSHTEPDNPEILVLNDRSEPETKKGLIPSRHAFTWDFSQEIRQVLGTRLTRQSSGPKSSLNMSYKIPFQDETQSLSSEPGLPRKDYIAYLAQVADYHLNASYCFFSLPLFLEQLNKTSLHSPKSISAIWLVKLFMVVAFGKLFLEKGATIAGPPGIQEFLEGTRALPSQVMLNEDPVTAVEALCLLSIYAQAADLHRVAYLYISQASRLALAWKLNCTWNYPAEFTSAGENYVQNIWWTACVLEQRYSTAIGVVSDHSIHKQCGPNHSNDFHNGSNVALRFNLSIANILTRVMTVLSKYKIGDIISLSMMNEIILELTAMRSLAHEMSNIPALCDGSSLSTISRSIATLHLLYYHCVMIATKPILTHLTKLRLTERAHSTSENASLELALKIVRTSINAASRSLNIIIILHEQNLLETFMFFDLEVTFLAALSLILANTIIPDSTDPSFVDKAKEILREMGRRGNIPAIALRDELDDMCRLMSGHQLHPPSSETNGPFSNIDKQISITMIRDGQALNNALSDVIEIQSPLYHVGGSASDTLARNQSGPPNTEKPSTATQDHPAPAAVDNMPPLNEMHIDGFELGGMESSLSFDMADLQWLESVQ